MALRCAPPLQPPMRDNYTTTCDCLIIGSYGDQQDPGVREKVVPSKPAHYEGTGSTSKGIGPFLTGVSDDLNSILKCIQQDSYKNIGPVLSDVPRAQRSRFYYLSEITDFLRSCKTNGGNSISLNSSKNLFIRWD